MSPFPSYLVPYRYLLIQFGKPDQTKPDQFLGDNGISETTVAYEPSFELH